MDKGGTHTGSNTDAKRSCVRVFDIVWNLNLQITSGDDVVGEGTILLVRPISTVMMSYPRLGTCSRQKMQQVAAQVTYAPWTKPAMRSPCFHFLDTLGPISSTTPA
jgi:hypothetical protein